MLTNAEKQSVLLLIGEIAEELKYSEPRTESLQEVVRFFFQPNEKLKASTGQHFSTMVLWFNEAEDGSKEKRRLRSLIDLVADIRRPPKKSLGTALRPIDYALNISELVKNLSTFVDGDHKTEVVQHRNAGRKAHGKNAEFYRLVETYKRETNSKTVRLKPLAEFLDKMDLHYTAEEVKSKWRNHVRFAKNSHQGS